MPNLPHLSQSDLLLLGIGSAAGLATALGGLLALSLKASIGLLAGFDVIAPAAGIGLSRLLQLPEAASALLLAAFGGFFLYAGASELVPDAHERRPRASTSLATILGLGFLYLVVRFSGATSL